jgi:putative ABC transport system substrate-binding protein
MVAPASKPFLDAFVDRLRALGWEQGRNLIIETRHTDGKSEQYAALAAELVALTPDVIVAPNSQAVAAAIAQTASIAIVMIGVSHPVEAGFIKSLANPASNVTGITNQLKDVDLKHYELLREIRPGLERIGVIFTSRNPGSVLSLQDAIVGTRQAGITVVPIPLEGPADIEAASAILTRERPQALEVHAAVLATNKLADIAKLATDHGLPTVAAFKFMARGGLLMSYGPDEVESWPHAARYVDRLLRGERPSNLPVEQPTKFDLVINLNTANALGITVPLTLQAQADEVIE